MRVSVICTVLNEGESIRRMLDSLVAQTRQPDEVVIVDGGSRDNTVAVIESYADRLKLRVLIEPGANISRGRNVAIRTATGDVIASTDAGVWLEPAWLAALVAPLESGQISESANQQIDQSANRKSAIRNPQSAIPNPQSVAGFFVPDPQTPFEAAMGATVLPAIGDVDPGAFLPSSRSVAFRKEAWAAAGGYPEWLDYCEDLIFDFRLQDATGPFVWAPGAVAHFRPRGSMRAYFKQYYRYARGDGKADLWRKRHAIRYATYLVALPAVLILSIAHSPLWLLGLAGGAVVYCRTPFRRLHAHLLNLAPVDQLRAIALIPAIRAVGDVAKMVGYPAGWVWRLRHWRDPEVHWQMSKTRGVS
ncbi:MAG: glycosyl transferase family 2 [Chloroflexi bacterium HGW-Chloroflexi-1]|nr:MAG: glycosyl transferase family 2 [Chloroflexi bacterium HGW-Chloroflexi-1]